MRLNFGIFVYIFEDVFLLDLKLWECDVENMNLEMIKRREENFKMIVLIVLERVKKIIYLWNERMML